MLSNLLRNAEGLIAVSNGFLQWGLKKINRSKALFDKVFYLGYKSQSKINVGKNDGSKYPVWLQGTDNQKLFVFIGTFGVSYELELILEVARRFKKSRCVVAQGVSSGGKPARMANDGFFSAGRPRRWDCRHASRS